MYIRYFGLFLVCNHFSVGYIFDFILDDYSTFVRHSKKRYSVTKKNGYQIVLGPKTSVGRVRNFFMSKWGPYKRRPII